MINTQFTIPVTASAEAAHALDRFALDFMGYSKTLGQYFAAADQAPEAPLVQAYAGALHMALEANTGLAASRPYLARATAHAPNASGPEQQVIRAILDWSAGDHVGALCGLLRHVHEAPRDILAAKWGQYLAFNLGRADDMLRFATLTTPHHEGLAEAHGMLAFGLEQTHQLQAAEEEGRRALSAKRSDAWAQHAVAHVMETQGRVDEGIAFLMAHSDTWADRSVFMREHNWWHVALYYLERGDIKKVLDLYDTKVWGGARKATPKDQVGAISLLLRLEIRGVYVGDRWQNLAAYLRPRIHEHALAFQDLHYIYALARTGSSQAVSEMLTSMKKHAITASIAWTEVAIPAAQGMIAHANGDWSKTVDLLKPVLPKLSEIGGSHAQRKLFDQVYFDALKATSMVSRNRFAIV